MTKQTRKPRNIDYDASSKLESRVSLLDIAVPPGWQIYVTKSNRGYARSNSKTVTAPAWSYYHTDRKTNDDPDHVIHYIAHELAHAWAYEDGGDIKEHGRAFYAKYKELCPAGLWHYELEYKPRNAKVSGIDPNPEVNKGLRYGFEQARDATAPTTRRTFRPSATDADVKREAIKRDPRLKEKLAGLPDDKVRGYINGWFKKPSKA